MLKQLLFRFQDRKQLYIAVGGAFLGMSFLITSIHYLIQVNEFGEGADVLGPNTIIIGKKVSNANTLALAKTEFTEREIEQLKQEPGVIDARPVIANNFDVSFETADPLVPRFRSNVFIQTVSQEFIDVKTDKWQWKPGDTIVPLIMPREFLVMLNTYASASNIPQISDELAMDIGFKFTLQNDSLKEWMNVRIVGFTNEISSMLVPESFMKWANERYGKSEPMKITQVMLSGKESSFGLIENMMKLRHYESKKSQAVIGRLKSIVSTLILVVLVISIIAVFLSVLVLIQYLQLLITRNAYEVRTLLRLGYHPKVLIRQFFVYFTKVFGIVALMSLAVFASLKFYLDSVFEEGGLYIGTNFTLMSISALFIAYGIFAFTSYRSAKKGITNANNG